MEASSEFVAQVADAYEHLYDLVYLRNHHLVDLLMPGSPLPHKEKAWELHQALLAVIEELRPGPQAPPSSREWQRYRAWVLRYVQGLDPQPVAEQLAISRRQYYRLHEAALAAIAQVLWQHCTSQAASAPGAPPAAPEPAPDGDLQLLRLEIARLSQADRYARLGEVALGLQSLLQGMLEQRGMSLLLALPDSLPSIAVGRNLLRQMLLGVLGYLIEHGTQATLQLVARVEEMTVFVSARVEPPAAVRPALQGEVEERLAAFEEMTASSGIRILTLHAGQSVVGFEVRLPVAQRTVLVVDDSEDALSLFHRFLNPHRYNVVTARTAQEALEKARQLQPYAITLDLMMPDQDGWDLLQLLLNQPDTRHIPIIVCTVLRQQRELALSLGAAAFVAKPVTEQALLTTLAALEER